MKLKLTDLPEVSDSPLLVGGEERKVPDGSGPEINDLDALSREFSALMEDDVPDPASDSPKKGEEASSGDTRTDEGRQVDDMPLRDDPKPRGGKDRTTETPKFPHDFPFKADRAEKREVTSEDPTPEKEVATIHDRRPYSGSEDRELIALTEALRRIPVGLAAGSPDSLSEKPFSPLNTPPSPPSTGESGSKSSREGGLEGGGSTSGEDSRPGSGIDPPEVEGARTPPSGPPGSEMLPEPGDRVTVSDGRPPGKKEIHISPKPDGLPEVSDFPPLKGEEEKKGVDGSGPELKDLNVHSRELVFPGEAAPKIAGDSLKRVEGAPMDPTLSPPPERPSPATPLDMHAIFKEQMKKGREEFKETGTDKGEKIQNVPLHGEPKATGGAGRAVEKPEAPADSPLETGRAELKDLTPEGDVHTVDDRQPFFRIEDREIIDELEIRGRIPVELAAGSPVVGSPEVKEARSPSPGARVPEMVRELVDRILVSDRHLSGKEEVRITLKDSVLEGTEVRIEKTDDGVRITLETSSNSSFQVLSERGEDLRARLKDQLDTPVQVELTFKRSREEQNEGRSRQRRSVLEEQQE